MAVEGLGISAEQGEFGFMGSGNKTSSMTELSGAGIWALNF